MEVDTEVDIKPRGFGDERWSNFVRWEKAMTEVPEAITSKPFLMKHMKFSSSSLSSVESSSTADVLIRLVGKVKTMQVDSLEDNTPLETAVGRVMKTFKMAGVEKFDGSQECDPDIWKRSMETALGTHFVDPKIHLRIGFLWLDGAALCANHFREAQITEVFLSLSQIQISLHCYAGLNK